MLSSCFADVGCDRQDFHFGLLCLVGGISSHRILCHGFLEMSNSLLWLELDPSSISLAWVERTPLAQQEPSFLGTPHHSICRLMPPHDLLLSADRN